MGIKAFILAAAVTLPLQQMDQWQVLEYRKIEANQVSFEATGMAVDVTSSASPIIYPLAEPVIVKGIEVSGRLSKLLAVDPALQGDDEHDDFALKIGLVVAGDQTLGGMQKLFSPDWVVTLFELAPEGTGIDHIHFLTAVQGPERLQQQRVHPLSELIREHNVWLLDKPGAFSLTHRLDAPLQVVAVWLSIDGDNSQSSFRTHLEQLRLLQ